MAYVFEDEVQSRYVFEDEKPKRTFAPKEPVGHYEGWIKPTLQDIGEGIAATPRTIGSVATGMLAWPIGKALGVGTLMEGGTVEEARKREEDVASYAIQPKGKAGTQATEMIGKVIETGLIPAKMVGEQAAKNWGEKAGYLMELAGELATFYMAGQGAKKAGAYAKEKKISKQLLDKKLSKLTPEERAYVSEVAKGHVVKDVPSEAPKLDKTFAAHEEGVRFTEGIKKQAEKVSERKALPEGKAQLPVPRAATIELPHEVTLTDPKVIKPKLQKKLAAPGRQKKLPAGQGFEMVGKGRYVFEETKPKLPKPLPAIPKRPVKAKPAKKLPEVKAEKIRPKKEVISFEEAGKMLDSGKDLPPLTFPLTEMLKAERKAPKAVKPKKQVMPIKTEKPKGKAPVKAGKVKEPWEMARDEYVSVFTALNKKTTMAEKTPGRKLTQKEVKLWRKNWEAFSRKRGYTEKEISDFKRFKQLATKKFPEEYGSVKAIHKDHIKKALSEGKPVPESVLKDYPDLKKQPKKESILKSQKGEVEIDIKAIKEGMKKVVEDLEESPTYKGLKETAKVTARGFKEGVRSPEDVYKPDPAGRKIYRTLDRASQKETAFKAVEGNKFARAIEGIKIGSKGDDKIGMALDGKIKRNTLTAKQRKAYDFFKKQYHFLIHKYARTVAGSEEGYLKVVRAASREKPIGVRVKDLPPKMQKKYEALQKRLVKIRKGRTLKELGVDSEPYRKVRKEMSLTLNRGWTENLTVGERAAFDVLSSKIKNYLPHMFDRAELLSEFKVEAAQLRKNLKTATNPSTVTQFKNRLRKLEDGIVRLEKGYMVTFDALPQNIRFKYFQPRTGKGGYPFSAIKAYESYLTGIAKKIYIEPAVKEIAQLHKELPPDLKSYNKWYIRRYMGWDRSPLDTLSGAIVSAQWMRTLGANPRSALVNLTQRLNTIVEVGERQTLGRPILSALHLKKGELLGYTKKGSKLFDGTGIAKEVPQVLVEGNIPAGMEGLRSVLGYMFSKVEVGNRKHAFLSGYSLAKSGKMSPRMAKRYAVENPKKMTEAECVQFGIDVVHKTQFRYGKIGMPKILTHPVGRVAFQFWSYPIKQTEFMLDLLKGNPKKLIKLLAYAEGSKYMLDEFLNTDLSNALGVGITWGEALKAVQAIPEGDWRGFFRHARLTFGGGGGVLPSGLGPTATGVSRVASAIRQGRGFQALKKELTPVQWKRFSQAYDALKNRKGDKYPIYNKRKHLMYYVTSKELAMRTIGPRPARESKQYIEWQKGRLLEQERREVLQDIVKALVEGNGKKANKLMNKYQIEPTDAAIEAEILKRKLTNKERKTMKEPGKIEEYQYQREGKIY